MKRKIKLTENDLHNIIKKSINRVLNEELSVSYPKSWNDEGTTYSQTIKIGLTQEDLDSLNSKLIEMADDYDKPDENGLTSHHTLNGHVMDSKNLRKILKFGKNYLKLSQLYALSELLNWGEYKRVKMDRNTIINIVQI